MTTLYRKYRPQSWSDVAGQAHVKVTLAFEAQTGRVAHAYLFSGPRGVGKTTVARILARAVNCERITAARGTPDASGEPCGECPSCRLVLGGETMDIIEIDAASHRGIDAVRENVIEGSRFAPTRLARKVFIIDEVHMLTTEAFNALLKTLEEPPSHVTFILATTELHKVPATVASRCQRFDFRKVPFAEAVERLQKVAAREGVAVDAETLAAIARAAEGCLRDAESLLGKVLTLGDGREVTHAAAALVLPRSDWQLATTYLEALLRRDVRTALAAVEDVVEEGLDPEDFADAVVRVAREVLLVRLAGNPDAVVPDLDEARKQQLSDLAALAEPPRLVHILELLMEKRKEMRGAHPPQLPLELAAVRAAENMVGLQPVSAVVAPVAAGHPPVPPPRVVSPYANPPTPSTYAKATVDGRLRGTGAPGDKPEKPTSKISFAEVKAAVAASIGLSREDAVKDEKAEVKEPEKAAACDLEHIHRAWPEFVKKATASHFGLAYLLSVGRPLEVRGEVVVIGFEFSYHCEKLNKPKNRQSLEEALSSAAGQPLRVEGRLTERRARTEDGELITEGKAAKTAEIPTGVAAELAATFGG